MPASSLLLFVLALVWLVAFGYRSTLPPSEIAIAAGPQGGGYYDVAQRYQKALARHGIKLRIVETSGAKENLALIGAEKPAVQAALVQGGLSVKRSNPEVASVGRQFYEPLLIFTAARLGQINRVSELKGRRIAIGGDGTGTQTLVRE